jgi:hypothetical protein
MSLEAPVIAIGWKELQGSKASPILVLYFGTDVEAGTDAVNRGLDSGSIVVGYVLRGRQPFAGQLMFAATSDNRPNPVGQLQPAGGS